MDYGEYCLTIKLNLESGFIWLGIRLRYHESWGNFGTYVIPRRIVNKIFKI